jgi:hypothetical protein
VESAHSFIQAGIAGELLRKVTLIGGRSARHRGLHLHAAMKSALEMMSKGVCEFYC